MGREVTSPSPKAAFYVAAYKVVPVTARPPQIHSTLERIDQHCFLAMNFLVSTPFFTIYRSRTLTMVNELIRSRLKFSLLFSFYFILFYFFYLLGLVWALCDYSLSFLSLFFTVCGLIYWRAERLEGMMDVKIKAWRNEMCRV